MNTTSGTSAVTFRTMLGVLGALLLAACTTPPPRPTPPPIPQALVASANQGNPVAQLTLGRRALVRARTPAEQEAAAVWIRKAAQANLAMAQGQLGQLYLAGVGVPQDTTSGLDWLRRSANGGAPAAMLQLGDIYAVGVIVPVDKAQAYYWYSLAAKPVRSDVTIFNIKQVRSFARKRARTLADSLSPAEQASIAGRVAAWVPTPGVPYSGTVEMYGLRR